MNIRTLLLAAALALPLAATAQDAAKPEAQEQATEAAPAGDATPTAKVRECTATTGSRIKPRPENNCAGPRPFRSYSADDFERTGKISLSEALRSLDPIFR